MVEVEYVREGRVQPAGEGVELQAAIAAITPCILYWLQERTWRSPLVALGEVEEGTALRKNTTCSSSSDIPFIEVYVQLLARDVDAPLEFKSFRGMVSQQQEQQLALRDPGGIGARAQNLIRASLRLALRASFAEPTLQLRFGVPQGAFVVVAR
ncbi:hypothetical protein GPECTOR_5g36 [Gonium pectorale]|uniref:Uncharacterized protein n=1 Tax=Gonium pectorale TaxID=33097 RepID=A0A150GWP0_GONPE|nr:hypothetical protein GPECTOR_5g36 [Gonium pectorale]|eukprot:KXZ54271.1 hypothetical protein GPECTOR_5g36 [Gonium pectorale]